MHRIRGRLTYANVIATIALFIALGGASYAAIKLPKNSVGAKQLKKGAVTPAKLSKASATTLAGPAGAEGATGPQGVQGVKGEAGAAATNLWAAVNEKGTLVRGVGVARAEMTGTGQYAVEFAKDVSKCAYEVTTGETGDVGSAPTGLVGVGPNPGNAKALVVWTAHQDATFQNFAFYLTVFC